jgi:hypothetical protein
VCKQHLANSFSANVDAINASHEVAAVTLKYDAVLSPVIVLVVAIPYTLELLVRSGFRVENETVLSKHGNLFKED